MEIIKPTSNFDFKRLTLANPEPFQNGNYFTKISLENGKPCCIQMPKCSTKQGLVDVKGAKYCDLMYERIDNEDLMNWLEQLEYTCQDKLCEKKDLWFQTELSRDDIESMMSPIMRVYQSGKYILLRVSLTAQKINGLEKSIAYNEQEVSIDLDKLEVTDTIVPLLIIHGIKFSARSFELEIKLSQMMIFNKPTDSPCLIKCVDNVGNSVLPLTPLNIKTTLAKTVEPILEPINKDKGLVIVDVNKPIVDKPIININKPFVNVNKPIIDKPIIDKPIVNIDKPIIDIDKTNPSLEEVSLDYESISDSISLKNPNEVYYEIYKAARVKAKQLRKVAMEAYLEAKEIKTKYMLTEIDDDDDDDSSSSSESSEDELDVEYIN